MTIEAESLPEIRRATKRQAAEFCGVSLTTFENWLRRGCPVVQRGDRATPWVFDLYAVTAWRVRRELGGDTASSSPFDPESMEPRELKDWYDAQLKQRELMKRDRELIPVADVESCIAQAFASIAQGVRAIPDNLERAAGVSPEVADTVSRMLDEQLSTLADRLALLAPVEDCDALE